MYIPLTSDQKPIDDWTEFRGGNETANLRYIFNHQCAIIGLADQMWRRVDEYHSESICYH